MKQIVAQKAIAKPRELSFVITLKILRCRLPEVPRSPRGLKRWHQDLLAEVAEERLEPQGQRVLLDRMRQNAESDHLPR